MDTQGSSCLSYWGQVNYLLAEHWQKTGIPHLSLSDANRILLEVDIDRTPNNKKYLRLLYGSFLETQGQLYQSGWVVGLRVFTVLWVAIIQQAEATGLVTGPFDGVYKLDEGGLDSGSISRLA